MHWVNIALQGALDLTLWPVSSLEPILGLCLIALIVSVTILLVVRASSDQRSLMVVRRRIHAALLEMRLLNDDAYALRRATGEILRANARYLRSAVVPSLWVTIPLLPLLIHLQFYYGYDGLAVGTTTVVTVRPDSAELSGGGAAAPQITLNAPPGLRVETPLVWIPSTGEAAWRIGAEEPGDYELEVSVDGKVASKTVRVSQAPGWRSPERLRKGFLNQLLAPVEPPIDPAVGISSIRLTYPPRRMWVLGFRTHWTIPFLVIVGGITFGLGRRFRILL